MNCLALSHFLYHPGAPCPSSPSPRLGGHGDWILTLDFHGLLQLGAGLSFCVLFGLDLKLSQLIVAWFPSCGQIPYSLVPNPVPEIFLIRPCHILQTFWFLNSVFYHVPDPRLVNLFTGPLDSNLDPVFMSLTLCLWFQWTVAHFPTQLWLLHVPICLAPYKLKLGL